MSTNTKNDPRYALVISVQIGRIRDTFISAGPEFVPMLAKFTQSYILDEKGVDKNGRARAEIGEDITSLLVRFGKERTKWETIQELQREETNASSPSK